MRIEEDSLSDENHALMMMRVLRMLQFFTVSPRMAELRGLSVMMVRSVLRMKSLDDVEDEESR